MGTQLRPEWDIDSMAKSSKEGCHRLWSVSEY